MSFSSLQNKKMKSSEFLKGEVSFEQKAEILLEVLSSIPSFVGETFVIKCGSVTIDHTIFAKIEGWVSFRRSANKKTFIDILPTDNMKASA